MYDIAIIGAGAVGGFVARELSRYNLKIVIFEKEVDVAGGVTKANTAIIHSGYSPKPGTIKAKLNREAIEIFPQVCKELDISYKKTGSLLIAFNEESMEAVHKKYTRGIKNGVKSLKILTKEEILAIEPNMNKNVYGALYSQDTGIVNNWDMAIAPCENAVDNGVALRTREKVYRINKSEDTFYIDTEKDQYQSKVVINCAGLFSDEINQMVGKKSFKIEPKKGQYFILDKNQGSMVNHVIFLAKSENDKNTKGMIIAPTINGNIIIGPSSQNPCNKEDMSTTVFGLNKVKSLAKDVIPNLDFSKTIKTFAGLRPKVDFAEDEENDFIIEEDQHVGGLINVAGIKSPGLTCAPSIALMVKDIVENILGKLQPKDDFNPYRKKVIRFNELDEEERNKRIKENPLYGKIVCKCENISEGEIIDAIRRNPSPTTIKGLKFRTMVGMGRCQGGFCMCSLIEILSRESNKKRLRWDGDKNSLGDKSMEKMDG
ncbi:NAD(P)/FAD-dependent oxidoreductase [Alkaliphilus oremlandii]|uniref:FAD dependent oxidoreductase n=1 Tax=Alkaliphilus oremlandii (strain OhILAs) TaxID=350688 RepID=A8MKU8_ALKOO|nr:NAD(P)/FAD-dependent oxidoreductase [Alkaliphilus oremlandii]ABW17765.1 FAD dependent oxidoreductase [Alkaliphilus oremlandii OhILAs]